MRRRPGLSSSHRVPGRRSSSSVTGPGSRLSSSPAGRCSVRAKRHTSCTRLSVAGVPSTCRERAPGGPPNRWRAAHSHSCPSPRTGAAQGVRAGTQLCSARRTRTPAALVAAAAKPYSVSVGRAMAWRGTLSAHSRAAPPHDAPQPCASPPRLLPRSFRRRGGACSKSGGGRAQRSGGYRGAAAARSACRGVAHRVDKGVEMVTRRPGASKSRRTEKTRRPCFIFFFFFVCASFRCFTASNGR